MPCRRQKGLNCPRRDGYVSDNFEVQEVQEGGKVEFKVPFPKGTRVAVFVVEELEDDIGDLLSAAQSRLDFWDNPIDDEVWNDV